MPVIPSRATGMCRSGTPIEDYTAEYGLFVKREDLSCPPPGPPFSKARGVFAHLQTRPEKLIGVLDTGHSQAGWAVARACQILGKKCINFYPAFKSNPGPHPAQFQSRKLGAELYPLTAMMSAVLFNIAKSKCRELGAYIMPNALKLDESVTETANEVPNESYDQVIIPASSGTIAAGAIRGFDDRGYSPTYLIHLGYSRSHEQVEKYLLEKSGVGTAKLVLIDEKYAYKDSARIGLTPPWPCNEFYDLKALRWWLANRAAFKGRTLFWNIG